MSYFVISVYIDPKYGITLLYPGPTYYPNPNPNANSKSLT